MGDNNDARVVCRMLGYGSGIAVQNAAYGPVQGKFIINNVDCKGTEANIHQCTKSNAHKCHGPEGAGVICIPEGNADIKCPGNWDMAGTGCYPYLLKRCLGQKLNGTVSRDMVS